jgi:hypothetical protein
MRNQTREQAGAEGFRESARPIPICEKDKKFRTHYPRRRNRFSSSEDALGQEAARILPIHDAAEDYHADSL